MSAPYQTTPSSPTPSKSSLRRTSASRNSSQRNLLPPPSPRFEDAPSAQVRYSPRSPPNQTLDYDSDDSDDQDDQEAALVGSYFPTSEQHELDRPFQPFFTLIEDGLTSEHHHPSVHYIFADDDQEIITEAAVRSLQQDDVEESVMTAQEKTETPLDNGRLPPQTAGTVDHFLVLDVQPVSHTQASDVKDEESVQRRITSQMYAVTAATSLSPEWQITGSTITSAPTMGDRHDNGEGLMLRIEGRGWTETDGEEKPGATYTGRDTEVVEDLIERFQQRLGEIRKLMYADSQHYAHTGDIQEESLGERD